MSYVYFVDTNLKIKRYGSSFSGPTYKMTSTVSIRQDTATRKLWDPMDPRYTFTNPAKQRDCWVCGDKTKFLFMGEPQHQECEQKGWEYSGGY